MTKDLTETRLRLGWTKARLRGQRVPAWRVALPLGVALSLAAALPLAALTASGPEESYWLAFAIYVAFIWVPLSTLAWVLVVDRNTVRGALSRPEDSVENTWYDQAAVGVFHDSLIVAGLGAAVFNFWHLSPDLGLLALALTLLLVMDFAVRYQIHRRRGRA